MSRRNSRTARLWAGKRKNNMKTQHTPAPWSVIKGSPQAGIITAPNRSLGIAEVFGGGETDIANARLIAAAPDLLAACRCALADMEGSYSREDWDDDENPVALTIRELIAAIAKAGGGK